MDPQKKNSLTEEASVGGAPPWAADLFDKMKKEICAEMHARIAYSMRIMLDHLKDEILNHSGDSQSKSEASDTCFCKELKKCKACKEKKHAAKAAFHSQRKEDKKLFKLNKRKVLSESSDTDNEVQSIVKQKSMTSSMTESKMVAKQQFTCSGSSSVSEDYNMAASMLSMKQDDPNDGAKIINSSTKTDTKDEEGAVMVANPTEVKLVAKENGKQDASAVECEFADAYTVSRSQSNPSDSEFEVISLPPNANTTSYYSTTGDRDLLTSDVDDTSGQCSETETETEFKDCKQSVSEIAPDGSSKALSNLLLDETKAIMSSMSSTTSSDSRATLHEGNLIEADDSNAISPLERQRAPYSAGPLEVEKINQGHIINNQPLPSEFLRDRKPYSQAHVETKPHTPEHQPRAQAQPQTQTPTPPKPTPRSNSTYRVDHLPESLWDEALTVAAQTYNAAKIAVENLADTFVPGAIPGPPRTGIPMPAPTGAAPATPKPSVPAGLTEKERKLYEMGFTDIRRNSELLRRFNGDMHVVIQQLLGS